jgi:hypothetical protein
LPDQGHWKTVTLVAALRRRGMRAEQTIPRLRRPIRHFTATIIAR